MENERNTRALCKQGIPFAKWDIFPNVMVKRKKRHNRYTKNFLTGTEEGKFGAAVG